VTKPKCRACGKPATGIRRIYGHGGKPNPIGLPLIGVFDMCRACYERPDSEVARMVKMLKRPARKPVPFRRWRVVGEVLRYSAGEGFDEVPTLGLLAKLLNRARVVLPKGTK